MSTLPLPTWCPILPDVEVERVHRVIQEIAGAVRSDYPPDPNDPSLAGGSAGTALFFTELARVFSLERYGEEALKYWRCACEGLRNRITSPSLLNGFTGVAWLTAYCESSWLDSGGLDLHEELEAVLEDHLENNSRPASLDLSSGIVGFGVYALERLPGQAARRILSGCVDELNRRAEHTDAGISWFTLPGASARGWQREYPRGYYDLGLAHGVAGIVVFLSRCFEVDENIEKVRPLLEGACAWLVAQQLKLGQEGRHKPQGVTSGACFPSILPVEDVALEGRLAWCYGDLAVATALLAASRVLGRSDLRDLALETALRTASIRWDEENVLNPGFCHGAAGVAHVFNRLAQSTANQDLKSAARYWLQVTLEMRKGTLGIAGFGAPAKDANGTKVWRGNASFLTGSVGTALVLLAAAGGIPDWDRVLLLSA